jgi:hypothetical protein
VVVCYFDISGVAVQPDETDTILIVDPDRILADTISLEPMEIQPWSGTKIVQRLGRGEKRQPSPSSLVELRRKDASGTLRVRARSNVASPAIGVAADRHFTILAQSDKAFKVLGAA